jgi:UDP-N-acetyl-2-amino-2-deoxyglucuronate dehydrogenase
MVKMAVVGCGRISYKHIEAIADNQDKLHLVAVCDIDRKKAEVRREQFESKTGKTTKIYENYEEMLENEDFDMVAIATESGKHYSISKYFLENGKHVLVEKPMALSTAEMDEMNELSKKNNVKLGVCHQNRFNDPIIELRKKIEDGSFGKINYGTINVRWYRDKNYYDQASWRGTWEMDGGSLMNQCIHGIDLLIWMLGKPVKVYGKIKNFVHPYIEAEDFGSAVIEFENGSIGTIEGTTTVYPKNYEETLSVFGEKGSVEIGGLAVNKINLWRFDGEDNSPVIEGKDPDTVYGYGHTKLYKEFVDSIEKNEDFLINGESGALAPKMVLAIYKSFKEGRPVDFPTEFSTLQMKGMDLKLFS